MAKRLRVALQLACADQRAAKKMAACVVDPEVRVPWNNSLGYIAYRSEAYCNFTAMRASMEWCEDERRTDADLTGQFSSVF